MTGRGILVENPESPQRQAEQIEAELSDGGDTRDTWGVYRR